MAHADMTTERVRKLREYLTRPTQAEDVVWKRLETGECIALCDALLEARAELDDRRSKDARALDMVLEVRRRETWAEAAHWVETQHPECVEIVEEFERRAKGEG